MSNWLVCGYAVALILISIVTTVKVLFPSL